MGDKEHYDCCCKVGESEGSRPFALAVATHFYQVLAMLYKLTLCDAVPILLGAQVSPQSDTAKNGGAGVVWLQSSCPNAELCRLGPPHSSLEALYLSEEREQPLGDAA